MDIKTCKKNNFISIKENFNKKKKNRILNQYLNLLNSTNVFVVLYFLMTIFCKNFGGWILILILQINIDLVGSGSTTLPNSKMHKNAA